MMEYYSSYMKRQEISRETHEKLLELGREGAARPRSVSPLRRWRGMTALAACCALIVGLGVWKLAPARNGGQPVGNIQGTVQSDSSPWAADSHSFVVEGADREKLLLPMLVGINYQDVNGSLEAAASSALPEGAFLQDLTKEGICTIFWGPEGKPEVDNPKNDPGDLPWMLRWDGYTVHGYAIYAGTGDLFVLYLFGEHPDGASFELALRPGALPPTCLANPGLETTDVFGVPVTGWKAAYDRNGDKVTDYVCGSEFMAGDVGVRFESLGAPFRVDPGDGWDPMAAAQQFNALFVNYAARGGLYLDHLLTAEMVEGTLTVDCGLP